jgi:hypothetical protein
VKSVCSSVCAFICDVSSTKRGNTLLQHGVSEERNSVVEWKINSVNTYARFRVSTAVLFRT